MALNANDEQILKDLKYEIQNVEEYAKLLRQSFDHNWMEYSETFEAFRKSYRKLIRLQSQWTPILVQRTGGISE